MSQRRLGAGPGETALSLVKVLSAPRAHHDKQRNGDKEQRAVLPRGECFSLAGRFENAFIFERMDGAPRASRAASNKSPVGAIPTVHHKSKKHKTSFIRAGASHPAPRAVLSTLVKALASRPLDCSRWSEEYGTPPAFEGIFAFVCVVVASAYQANRGAKRESEVSFLGWQRVDRCSVMIGGMEL